MKGGTSPLNVQPSSRRGDVAKESAKSRRVRNREDRGYTLIELLVVVTIIPLIVGALGAGLIEVFSLQTGVASRLGDSSDAQIVAANFTKDVQSASSLTTNATALCGTGTQLLGLEWGGSLEVVSYVDQSYNGTTYAMVRNDCTAGPSATPSSSTTLSYDFLPPCPVADTAAMCSSFAPPQQPAPVAYDNKTVVVTSVGPVSTIGITALQFPILEPKSNFVYHLSASPAGGASTPQTNLGAPSTGSSCGFALPGTGSFAATMCFIGFTTTELQAAYPNAGNTCSSTDPGQQGLDMSVDTPGGYVMSFCLTVVPGAGESQSATNPPPVVAVSTPIGGGTCRQQGQGCDWGHLSNGQGFLGNDNQVNGTATPFYSGIGCPVSTPNLKNNVVTSSCINPGIFQTTNGGNDTVTLSNIEVNDPAGDLATGYEVITVDAETVDPGNGAYIKWTSMQPTSRPLPFNLVPNFSSSDLGNACNEVPPSDTGAGNPTGWSINDGDTTVKIGSTDYTGSLTGLGTASVECQSNWQTSPPYLRTGTAMLGITPPAVNGGAEPVTIKAQLQGEGFNAVAFGLLLP
ncbi:MAG TPA: type II secretion system protein [Acidimicrobiales bacterium]|nr:type II secretion system protein [Acidimicrobiales bacterium]